MRKITMAVALAAALLASGCATYQAGSASQSDLLKRFEPIPGKGSVYVCRIPALLVARGVKTEIIIDNENIGTLKVNSFVHTAVEPGKHGVLLRHDGINRGAGRDSRSRFIYLHGTNQEHLLGRPASHGCIRLANRDIMELFDLTEGHPTYCWITDQPLAGLYE